MRPKLLCLLGLLASGCATQAPMAARTENATPEPAMAADMTPAAQADLYLGIIDGLIPR